MVNFLIGFYIGFAAGTYRYAVGTRYERAKIAAFWPKAVWDAWRDKGEG